MVMAFPNLFRPWEGRSHTYLNFNKAHVDAFRDVVNSEKRSPVPADVQDITSAVNPIIIPGLGAPLSSYLEGALYKLIYR